MRLLATIVVTVAAVFAATAGAHAEDRTPDPVKKAKAEALIAETKSDGVWRADDTGEITHIQSGLQCAVAGDDDIIQLIGLSTYPSVEKGTNVSCSFTLKGPTDAVSHITLYAYAAEGRSDRQLLDQSIAEAQTLHPDWKLEGGPAMTIGITDKAGKKLEPLSARFTFGASPKMFSSIWVGAVRNWAIKVRSTYPKDDASTAEMMSIIWWAGAHLHVTGDEADTGE